VIRHKTKNLKKLSESNALKCCTDSSVDVVISLRVGQSRDCASIPGRGKKFFLLNPAAFLTKTRVICLELQRPGCESNDSIVSRT
jgi:hypothetical protein